MQRSIFVCLILACRCPASTAREEETAEKKPGFCAKDSCNGAKVEFDRVNSNIIFRDTSEYLRYNTATALIGANMEDCSEGQENMAVCLLWPRFAKLEIRALEEEKSLACHEVTWHALSRDFSPYDCVNMFQTQWYGGAEFHNQKWPINDIEIPMQPFVSNDLYEHHHEFGNVLEPFWISSNGVGIIVNDSYPLHVSINEGGSGELCFRSDYSQRYFPWNDYNDLKYTVCKGKDIVDIFQSMSRMAFDPPTGMPDLRMMKKPVWSTWARYKTLINQSKVIEYANEIEHFGFPNCQLQIDDMYTTTYGDLDFDPEKFPDPTDMVQRLKGMGYRVTAWVHPFANLDSEAFLEGIENKYWVSDLSGEVPALIKWWQGVGAVLDTTNPKATEWFVNRLKTMQQEYGIESFKFDAGEMTYLPFSYKTFQRIKNPGYYTKAFVDAVSQFGDFIEVRCGYKSQTNPVFVRIADKDSNWGYTNGLKSLIPTALTLGLLGYPYILPDMIGGNGYGEVMGVDVVLPARELYIRWLQVTAYLPAMQFSFVPWDYDEEVVTIALRMVKAHEEIVTPILIKAAEDTQKSGWPLIRPLWWAAPDDPTALTIDNEFLVGNSLLVAPILDDGQRKRDIYLPKGEWMDMLRTEKVTGGKWLKNYAIDLKDIATFTRIVEQYKFV